MNKEITPREDKCEHEGCDKQIHIATSSGLFLCSDHGEEELKLIDSFNYGCEKMPKQGFQG